LGHMSAFGDVGRATWTILHEIGQNPMRIQLTGQSEINFVFHTFRHFIDAKLTLSPHNHELNLTFWLGRP